MAFVEGQPNMMRPANLSAMQGALTKKPKKPKQPKVPFMKPGRQFGSSAISGVLPKG